MTVHSYFLKSINDLDDFDGSQNIPTQSHIHIAITHRLRTYKCSFSYFILHVRSHVICISIEVDYLEKE